MFIFELETRKQKARQIVIGTLQNEYPVTDPLTIEQAVDDAFKMNQNAIVNALTDEGAEGASNLWLMHANPLVC